MFGRRAKIRPMSAIAMELEQVLHGLGAESARKLESEVRGVISKATREEKEWEAIMVLMKKNHPKIAPLIGAFADIDFEVAEDLPPEPLTDW